MRNRKRPERFSRADNAKPRRPRLGILINGPSRAGLLRDLRKAGSWDLTMMRCQNRVIRKVVNCNLL